MSGDKATLKKGGEKRVSEIPIQKKRKRK